jgi:hypothetical protein
MDRWRSGARAIARPHGFERHDELNNLHVVARFVNMWRRTDSHDEFRRLTKVRGQGQGATTTARSIGPVVTRESHAADHVAGRVRRCMTACCLMTASRTSAFSCRSAPPPRTTWAPARFDLSACVDLGYVPVQATRWSASRPDPSDEYPPRRSTNVEAARGSVAPAPFRTHCSDG